MKKILSLALALTLALATLVCAFAEENTVMTYAEFVEADIDSLVTIETYVQAKQSWWTDSETGVSQASFYTQAEDGAYFLYNMPCTEEEYEALVPGTKILVNGYKAEWSGEVEIIDTTFDIIDGEYIAEPTDVTDLLGTDELAEKINSLVSFTGLTVESEAIYKWDGSGADGDDLYFNVSKDGETYTFTVESYLTGAGTEVYEAVKNLKVGDTVNLEGFLYWYEGPQPHITSVTVAE